ncbi:hypothetical protein D8M06_08170 [Oceanobacillus halophilus]|uniref:Uncharacterized protein n=1 Tax=Oceanobacillus halophilus TaxID=930130 RepID=A0A495A4C7_9BACI|nr:hypothetical protein D8M06_08170 [Oceanobacillus halophilus]
MEIYLRGMSYINESSAYIYEQKQDIDKSRIYQRRKLIYQQREVGNQRKRCIYIRKEAGYRQWQRISTEKAVISTIKIGNQRIPSIYQHETTKYLHTHTTHKKSLYFN